MDNPYIKTPNLDRLAGSGTVFTRHIAANPVCMPSRVSLMTGLYPPGHGVYTNGIPLNRNEYANTHDWKLYEPLTMADAFQQAGYATASFGKLHLTPNIENDKREHKCPVYPETYGEMTKEEFRDWHGPYYGFEHVEFTAGHGEIPVTCGHYAFWLKDQAPALFAELIDYANPYGIKPEECGRIKLPLKENYDLYPSKIPHELHNTNWLAERFVDYLENQRPDDKPFFTYIGFPDPHHPFTPSYDIMAQFEGCTVKTPYDPEGSGIKEHPCGRKSGHIDPEVLRYTYAMIYQVDLAVGKIIDAVEKAGLWEDTIIVFTSDHGDFLGDHGLLYKAQFGSNALLHVPFIMRVPGAALPSRSDVPMSNVDVMPSLLACAGNDISGLRGHGEDITKCLDNFSRQVFAYASDSTPESVNYTVYDENFRYTWFPALGFDELFDHRRDPGEARNLASEPEYKSRVEIFRNAIKDKLIEHRNPIVGQISCF